MPTYILKCKKCNTEFEFFKLKSSSQAKCPKCSSEEDFEKLPTTPAVHFKGLGWTNNSYVESVDPCAVKGVTRVDNPTEEQQTAYRGPKKINDLDGRLKKFVKKRKKVYGE